jgi:N-carbamoylputrescine amidase
MRTVSLAALQLSCSWDRDRNIATADRLVRQAAARGAQVVLIPELFETPYFCAAQKSRTGARAAGCGFSHVSHGHRHGAQ